MVTRLVDGNFVGWASDISLGTLGRDPNTTGNPRSYSWAGFSPISGNSIFMPGKGKVVGFVLQVGFNSSFLDTIFEFRIEGVLIPGMKITVPASTLQSAFDFFSFVGPDVPELFRIFAKGDRIDFTNFKNLLEATAGGISDVTVMMLGEIEFD